MNGFTFFVRTWGLRLKTAKIAKKIPRAKINKGIFISVKFESSQTEKHRYMRESSAHSHFEFGNQASIPIFTSVNPIQVQSPQILQSFAYYRTAIVQKQTSYCWISIGTLFRNI